MTQFWPWENTHVLNGVSRKFIIFLIKGTELVVPLPSLPPAQNEDRMPRSREEIILWAWGQKPLAKDGIAERQRSIGLGWHWSFIPTQDCLPLLFLSHKKNTSLISVSYQLFNLLPFIFPQQIHLWSIQPLISELQPGSQRLLDFYEKVLSKLKAVIKEGIFFLSPFSYQPIKQELSSSWKYLEETFQLSWHSLVPRCERSDLLGWWNWEKLSSVHCSACSWLSLWDWPNRKATAPASSRQCAPGQPQTLLGRTSIVGCSAVSGWVRSNWGRRKRKPICALSLSHTHQSIWTNNKADILTPICLLWLFLNWINLEKWGVWLAPTNPYICWILSASGKSHS